MNQDPLNLRRLPAPEPPPGLWPDIRAQLEASARPQPRWAMLAPSLAALLAVAAVLLVLMPEPEDPGAPGIAAATPTEIAMSQSARLESELRYWQEQAVTAANLNSLALLETELAWLDLRLAQRPDDAGLWNQRGGLLAEMILRYAEADELNDWTPTQI